MEKKMVLFRNTFTDKGIDSGMAIINVSNIISLEEEPWYKQTVITFNANETQVIRVRSSALELARMLGIQYTEAT